MQEPQTAISMGFFSVLEIPELGFCGGLLILNHLGRPLEFHCTMPVKPTRTQEILFGDSLRPLLFGENIGASLIQKARTQPDVLWVDSCEAAGVDQHASFPVGQVVMDSEQGSEPLLRIARSSDNQPGRSDQDEGVGDHLKFGSKKILLSASDRDARRRVQCVLDQIDSDFSLAEPFSRIHEAIHEAHAVAR